MLAVNGYFDSVRQVLADQLSDGLKRAAVETPEVWRKIAYGHTDVIMGWASKDPDFFRMIADAVPVRTSRGRLTMPEYLDASGGVVYYTAHELGSLQEKLLAEARDVPAIDASWYAVPSFLESYRLLHPHVTLVRLEEEMDAILRPAPAGEFAELVQLCEELGFRVRVATFKPTDMPAVMTYPPDAETVRDAETALEQGLIPDGFSGLLRGYVERRRDVANDAGTLHLNASCPLIHRLATPEIAPAKRHAALAVVAYFARLFCGRMLDAPGAAADLRAWRRSLDQLV
jgi:hypothetical protein